MDFRSRQLDLVQQRVAIEERTRLSLQTAYDQAGQDIRQAFEEQDNQLDTLLLDPIWAQNFSNYVGRLKEKQAILKQKIEQHYQVTQAIREELRQAMIKKKALVILKEKAQARFLKDIEKQEEATLAELALNRSYYQKSSR